MGWSDAFVDALRSTLYQPQWTVEVVLTPAGRSGGHLFASHAGLVEGLSGTIIMGPQEVSQSVTPISWSATAGMWSFQVIGSVDVLLTQAPRGSIIRMQLTLGGVTETVLTGVIKGAALVKPGLYQVDVWDVTTALKSRLTDTASQLSLFYDLPISTTLATNYTVGDSTVYLTSSAGFEFEPGESGVVLLNGSFYLTYTGITGNNLTGVSATGQFGTTATNVSAGGSAQHIAHIVGHPLDMARKILTSTGAGTNGPYDVLPDSWGIGLPVDALDNADWDDWRDEVLVVASGSYSWDVLVADPVADAYSWLSGLLQSVGAWITQRQGSVVVRAAQAVVAPRLSSGQTIYRSALEEGGLYQWEAWDQVIGQEYGGMVATASGGSSTWTSDEVETWPAGDTYTYDVSAVAWTNDTEIRAEMLKRMQTWTTRIPQALYLSIRGWTPARYCPGDIVVVDFSTYPGAVPAVSQTGVEYDTVRCMVAEVATAWDRRTTRLKLWPARTD